VRTILVIDDNEKIVDVLSEYLRAEGFSTLTAADGTEALELAEERHPDLALVDVQIRVRRHRQLQHRQAVEGLGPGAIAMRRPAGRNQSEIADFQALGDFGCGAQVTVVDRVEGAPEDGHRPVADDPAAMRHGGHPRQPPG
jgi:AmiR/NasT family two-component response regulator